ncbi:hypothetical protein BHU72_08185 [Desulfuribacillus stibiiarsenatis]|uniref:DUF3842 family protein n=1 Tax=Desulfuribacillus stibiiarsenatis TaxID=1390249 RepID=A0A1E5L3T9_9FIRM|nr:CooT family nickel-binding protein [Desulfuribacillus stibiiarsenatis]OEH84802.1 hypothetical protein BHU72_08185 [Desulfuribacillus stibiiarsenatis]
MLKVAIIDGQGGGIGKVLTEHIRKALGEEVYLVALGTNALASSVMLKAGANEGASGENAIARGIAHVDVVIGPIGIVIPHSFLGEITPSIASIIACSKPYKILIPLTRGNYSLVGLNNEPLPHLVKESIEILYQYIDNIKSKEGSGMCEANAYIIKDGKEELLLERVDKIVPHEDGIFLKNIFGEQKIVKASIKEMALVNHKIILEPIS